MEKKFAVVLCQQLGRSSRVLKLNANAKSTERNFSSTATGPAFAKKHKKYTKGELWFFSSFILTPFTSYVLA